MPFLTHLLSPGHGGRHRRTWCWRTSYQAEVFADRLRRRAPTSGCELEYVIEDEPLGTGGGIRNVADRLRLDDRRWSSTATCCPGIDLGALVETHRAGAPT